LRRLFQHLRWHLRLQTPLRHWRHQTLLRHSHRWMRLRQRRPRRPGAGACATGARPCAGSQRLHPR
jgi:hypothetical protein